MINRWLSSCAEMSADEEKAEQKALTEEFKPLIDWLRNEAQDVIRDGASLLVFCFLIYLTVLVASGHFQPLSR